LVNFEEEEDRDRDALKLLIYNKNNLFKFLFDRYTSINHSLKRKTTFETL